MDHSEPVFDRKINPVCPGHVRREFTAPCSGIDGDFFEFRIMRVGSPLLGVGFLDVVILEIKAR